MGKLSHSSGRTAPQFWENCPTVMGELSENCPQFWENCVKTHSSGRTAPQFWENCPTVVGELSENCPQFRENCVKTVLPFLLVRCRYRMHSSVRTRTLVRRLVLPISSTSSLSLWLGERYPQMVVEVVVHSMRSEWLWPIPQVLEPAVCGLPAGFHISAAAHKPHNKTVLL